MGEGEWWWVFGVDWFEVEEKVIILVLGIVCYDVLGGGC